MYQSRRRLLTRFAGIAGGFTLLPALAAAVPFQRDPQPIPSPNAPNPNYPPGLNNAGVHPDSENKKSADPQVQSPTAFSAKIVPTLRRSVRETTPNARRRFCPVLCVRGNSCFEQRDHLGSRGREVSAEIPAGNQRCGLRVSRLRQ